MYISIYIYLLWVTSGAVSVGRWPLTVVHRVRTTPSPPWGPFHMTMIHNDRLFSGGGGNNWTKPQRDTQRCLRWIRDMNEFGCGSQKSTNSNTCGCRRKKKKRKRGGVGVFVFFEGLTVSATASSEPRPCRRSISSWRSGPTPDQHFWGRQWDALNTLGNYDSGEREITLCCSVIEWR